MEVAISIQKVSKSIQKYPKSYPKYFGPVSKSIQNSNERQHAKRNVGTRMHYVYIAASQQSLHLVKN